MTKKEKHKQLLGDWYGILNDELDKDYMQRISIYLGKRYKETYIYPAKENIFEAFKQCPYNSTRIVMIGQDPYHTPGTAHGLVFSTKQKKTPPSLQNIFKEINNELGEHRLNSNDLTQWANQGMLLLNVSLTVEKGRPGSHMNLGWREFTKKVLEKLNNHPNKIVFLLWGNFARSYKPMIDTNKHIILETTHPSPFSANSGFLGCGHFQQIKNIYPDIDFNIY